VKSIQIVLGTVGLVIVVAAGLEIKSKVEYDRNGREITKLIAEYKAMGVPTNGDELVKTIPDKENAWVEIGPILLSRRGEGTAILFKSSIAQELLLTCDKSDLPLIRKYLAENQSKREKIAAALNSKPSLQVPHDYDEGYMMLLPEYSAMRAVTREYCLAAYASGIEGNIPEAIRNLDLANRLAANCIARPDYVGVSVGASIRKNIVQSGSRIIEANGASAPQIEAFLTSPPMSTVADPKLVLRSEFIAQISIGRYFDVPEMDRTPVPKFLTWAINRKEPDYYKLGQVKHGDEMPASRTMRSLLRNRLEAWKPIMAELGTSTLPFAENYALASDMYSVMPKRLSFMMPDQPYFDRDQLFNGIGFAQVYRKMTKAMFKALAIKRQSGKYPPSLKDLKASINFLNPTEKLSYSVTEKSLLLRSEATSIGYTDTVPVLSYPAKESISENTMADYAFKVRKYRSGEMLFDGTAPVYKSRAGIPAPPGIPKPPFTHEP
jgi:hypothetical protein